MLTRWRIAIAAMRGAGGPYPVAGPSLSLATAALRAPASALAPYRAEVRRERQVLGELLAEHGAEVIPSQANFVFAMTPRADWLFAGLASLGIAVRRFPDRPGLRDTLRISCPGDVDAFAELHGALATALRPQALLFDLDGVLADVRQSYRQAIVQTAASFGVKIAPEEITAAKAAGDANNDWVLTRRLLAAHGREVSLDATTERFESLYQGELCERETLCVSREWLEALARRLPLGIVTGRPRADAERFLRRHEIEPCFATVVCMADAAAKPSPAPVRLALDRLGCDRAWLFGDTVDDVRAARAAGVLPLGVVAPGEDPVACGHALRTAGAARVLNDVTELTDLQDVLP